MDATYNFESQNDQTYNVIVKLEDSNPSFYSAVISKNAGGDPGPSIDFYSPNFTFEKVKPGRWYINVKKRINSQWSTIVYWTVDVPAWVAPTPIPTPFPTIIPKVQEIQTQDSSSFDLTSLITWGLLGGGVYWGIKKFRNRSKPKDPLDQE